MSSPALGPKDFFHKDLEFIANSTGHLQVKEDGSFAKAGIFRRIFGSLSEFFGVTNNTNKSLIEYRFIQKLVDGLEKKLITKEDSATIGLATMHIINQSGNKDLGRHKELLDLTENIFFKIALESSQLKDADNSNLSEYSIIYYKNHKDELEKTSIFTKIWPFSRPQKPDVEQPAKAVKEESPEDKDGSSLGSSQEEEQPQQHTGTKTDSREESGPGTITPIAVPQEPLALQGEIPASTTKPTVISDTPPKSEVQKNPPLDELCKSLQSKTTVVIAQPEKLETEEILMRYFEELMSKPLDTSRDLFDDWIFDNVLSVQADQKKQVAELGLLSEKIGPANAFAVLMRAYQANFQIRQAAKAENENIDPKTNEELKNNSKLFKNQLGALIEEYPDIYQELNLDNIKFDATQKEAQEHKEKLVAKAAKDRQVRNIGLGVLGGLIGAAGAIGTYYYINSPSSPTSEPIPAGAPNNSASTDTGATTQLGAGTAQPNVGAGTTQPSRAPFGPDMTSNATMSPVYPWMTVPQPTSPAPLSKPPAVSPAPLVDPYQIAEPFKVETQDDVFNTPLRGFNTTSSGLNTTSDATTSPLYQEASAQPPTSPAPVSEPSVIPTGEAPATQRLMIDSKPFWVKKLPKASPTEIPTSQQPATYANESLPLKDFAGEGLPPTLTHNLNGGADSQGGTGQASFHPAQQPPTQSHHASDWTSEMATLAAENPGASFGVVTGVLGLGLGIIALTKSFFAGKKEEAPVVEIADEGDAKGEVGEDVDNAEGEVGEDTGRVEGEVGENVGAQPQDVPPGVTPGGSKVEEGKVEQEPRADEAEVKEAAETTAGAEKPGADEAKEEGAAETPAGAEKPDEAKEEGAAETTAGAEKPDEAKVEQGTPTEESEKPIEIDTPEVVGTTAAEQTEIPNFSNREHELKYFERRLLDLAENVIDEDEKSKYALDLKAIRKAEKSKYSQRAHETIERLKKEFGIEEGISYELENKWHDRMKISLLLTSITAEQEEVWNRIMGRTPESVEEGKGKEKDTVDSPDILPAILRMSLTASQMLRSLPAIPIDFARIQVSKESLKSSEYWNRPLPDLPTNQSAFIPPTEEGEGKEDLSDSFVDLGDEKIEEGEREKDKQGLTGIPKEMLQAGFFGEGEFPLPPPPPPKGVFETEQKGIPSKSSQRQAAIEEADKVQAELIFKMNERHAFMNASLGESLSASFMGQSIDLSQSLTFKQVATEEDKLKALKEEAKNADTKEVPSLIEKLDELPLDTSSPEGLKKYFDNLEDILNKKLPVYVLKLKNIQDELKAIEDTSSGQYEEKKQEYKELNTALLQFGSAFLESLNKELKEAEKLEEAYHNTMKEYMEIATLINETVRRGANKTISEKEKLTAMVVQKERHAENLKKISESLKNIETTLKNVNKTSTLANTLEDFGRYQIASTNIVNQLNLEPLKNEQNALNHIHMILKDLHYIYTDTKGLQEGYYFNLTKKAEHLTETTNQRLESSITKQRKNIFEQRRDLIKIVSSMVVCVDKLKYIEENRDHLEGIAQRARNAMNTGADSFKNKFDQFRTENLETMNLSEVGSLNSSFMSSSGDWGSDSYQGD